ncbi:MAG: hypothetical protein WBF20_25875, partial [Trebonia sp.]|uniref:hypothetical protein n=1 Tax=Trebonia sp. TaxID=2767075 RepID=UPI003C71769E
PLNSSAPMALLTKPRISSPRLARNSESARSSGLTIRNGSALESAFSGLMGHLQMLLAHYEPGPSISMPRGRRFALA